MLNLKFISLIFMFLTLLFLAGLAMPHSAIAQNNANTEAHTILTKATLTPGNEASLPQARDAATHINDKRLTNNCIESGYNKTECLCLTRIFKYELSLKDYETMAVIFDDTESNVQTLLSYGYNRSKLNKLKVLSETLSKSADFTSRCAKAETYYSAEYSN